MVARQPRPVSLILSSPCYPSLCVPLPCAWACPGHWEESGGQGRYPRHLEAWFSACCYDRGREEGGRGAPCLGDAGYAKGKVTDNMTREL